MGKKSPKSEGDSTFELFFCLYFERPYSFLFVVFGNAPTFPALPQFSLNTTVIGLISYLRPSGERVEA